MTKPSNIKIKFNINTGKIKKISSEKFYDKDNKIYILINSKKKKEIFLKKNLAFYDYEKSNECTSLMIEFKNEKKIKLKTTFVL